MARGKLLGRAVRDQSAILRPDKPKETDTMQNTITIQIPLRQPKLSSTGNTVLLGTFSGKVETEFGTIRVTANAMAPADDADTAAIIAQVAKAVAKNPQAAKAPKQDKSAAKSIVLKSLQALPQAA